MHRFSRLRLCGRILLVDRRIWLRKIFWTCKMQDWKKYIWARERIANRDTSKDVFTAPSRRTPTLPNWNPNISAHHSLCRVFSIEWVSALFFRQRIDLVAAGVKSHRRYFEIWRYRSHFRLLFSPVDVFVPTSSPLADDGQWLIADSWRLPCLNLNRRKWCKRGLFCDASDTPDFVHLPACISAHAE